MREYETPCSDDSKKVCNCIKTAPIASDHNIYLNNEEPNIKEMQPNFTIRKPYDTIYIYIYLCVCVCSVKLFISAGSGKLLLENKREMSS